MTWAPSERPPWLARLIAHGPAVGGASKLVTLDPEELIATAIDSTDGLDDFGDAYAKDWREWFEVLARSLDTESSLHVAGRLLARHDLLRSLRNRLLLTDLWKRRPEILETEILPPSFVMGMARSGTSILSELLALDPSARTPALWEMLHPAESLVDERMRPLGHAETVFMEDLTPEYATMHHNSGDLPNECIFILLNTFICEIWSGSHSLPSYEEKLALADHRPAYDFHRCVLQTLQQRGAEGCTRWGLKAPSHLHHLDELFAVYPNAQAIRIHRDPLKSLPSTMSLTGTLKHMRCEQVDISQTLELFAEGNADILRQEIAKRSSGRVPDSQFIDVHYHDLIRDPRTTIRGIYERAGWEFSADVARKIEGYLRERPRGQHQYSLESMGLDRERERERFRFYCEHYGIPEEE